ncbi:MAG: hypothetical protein AAGI50_07200 [Pseudomonadota bacterium]
MPSIKAARFWFNPRRKAADPFLFFSYGMTKCGSTLAFQIARVALVQAGFPQPIVELPNMKSQPRINFLAQTSAECLAAIDRSLDDLGHPIAFKTHARPSDEAVRRVQRGRARAHGAYRDVRDMALSMLDAGVQARAKGRPAFSEIETLEDAVAGIDTQLDTLTAWFELPDVRAMPYARTAFATEEAAADVLDQLGIDGDPQKIAVQVHEREHTQLNKARPDRHKAEMDEATQAMFRARYAPFYALLHDTEPKLPLPPRTTLKSPDAGPAETKDRVT